MAHLISEYLYTGAYPSAESQDTELLLDILHLAHYWQLKVLLDEVQVKLIKHISLENYNDRESFFKR